MWISFAFASAVFAGLTAILAKYGVKNTDSNVATAVVQVSYCFFLGDGLCSGAQFGLRGN